MGIPMGTQVDERGRITLPQRLRKELGLSPGTEIRAERLEQGILIRRVVTKEEFKDAFEGCLDSSQSPGKSIDPLKVKQMWDPMHDRD